MNKKRCRIEAFVALMCFNFAAIVLGDYNNLPSGTIETNLKKHGLLIIAHGAPSTAWNEPVLKVGKNVITKLNKNGNNPFGKVQVVFMESAKPSVADGIEAIENAGCNRIIAVPLLIAPSSHSHWDVPALLGIYNDPNMTAEFKKEGAKLIRSKLPITLTPTLEHGTLLSDILLDNVREISNNPKEEAIVLLAHGDEYTQPIWDRMVRRIITRLCGETGITYGDWAFVHVGQNFAENGVPIIATACEEKKRVLLVGCYLSMTPEMMLKRYTMISEKGKMSNPLEGKEIISVRHTLCDSPKLIDWIVQTAKAAIEISDTVNSTDKERAK
jgi:hypothetical protein